MIFGIGDRVRIVPTKTSLPTLKETIGRLGTVTKYRPVGLFQYRVKLDGDDQDHLFKRDEVEQP